MPQKRSVSESDYLAGTTDSSGPVAVQPHFVAWVRRSKADPWKLICVGNDEAVPRRRLLGTHLDWQHAILPRGELPAGRLFAATAADEPAPRSR